MKTLLQSFVLACTMAMSIMFVACNTTNSSRTETDMMARFGKTEKVIYMSDIDGLVKAVMLYGVTNGIAYKGTNYVFVVEPTGPVKQ